MQSHHVEAVEALYQDQPAVNKLVKKANSLIENTTTGDYMGQLQDESKLTELQTAIDAVAGTQTSTVSYHGKGAINEIVPIAQSKGFKHIFVCSDPDLIKFNVTSKVTDLLDKAEIPYTVYSGIKPNPTIENVTDGVEAFKACGADSIIAIGGSTTTCLPR